MMPRRWFRFSLRTFFVVLTLLGVGLGYQVNWIRQRRAALAWLTEGHGVYWGVANGSDVDPQDPAYSEMFKAHPAPWSLQPFNEGGMARIFVGPCSPEAVNKLKRLFPEADVLDGRTREEIEEWPRSTRVPNSHSAGFK